MIYRNIIFDFDGTITDSREDIAGAQLWVLDRLGVTSYTKEDLYPYVGKSLHETFSRLLPPGLHHLIPEATKLYSEYYPPRSLLTTRLFRGVRETLEIMHREGKRLAIASTKRGTGIKRATDHFGITEYFVQLQGSDGVPFKPDPFIINKIINDQLWERPETLMVGDTDSDILAGKSAAIATCAVTYGSLTEEALSLHSPDFLVRSFPELLSVVDGGRATFAQRS
jgi:phosphoglycolate phosphatase